MWLWPGWMSRRMRTVKYGIKYHTGGFASLSQFRIMYTLHDHWAFFLKHTISFGFWNLSWSGCSIHLWAFVHVHTWSCKSLLTVLVFPENHNPERWNNVPVEISLSASVTSFKSLLKTNSYKLASSLWILLRLVGFFFCLLTLFWKVLYS